MKRTAKRFLSLFLSAVMVFSMLSLSALAAGAKTEGIWNYTVDGEGNAVIVGARDDYKTLPVVLIPARLGGAAVSSVGGGSGAVLTNYKGGGYILVPREIRTVADRAFYDCNPVTGWSVFSGTATAASSFNGCSGEHYGDAALSQTLAVSAGENGSILPNGTYGVPAGLADAGYSADFSVTAAIGYRIAALTVDGRPVEAAAGQNTYTLAYTFSRNSRSVEVTFEPDPNDTRTPDLSGSYEAPAIARGAAAAGAQLPSDVYTYIPDLSTDKYENSIGVSTGTWYAVDGALYEMVFISQSDPKCQSKAEAINYLFEQEGLVYGRDYDLLRVYNYEEDYQNGPRPDDFDFHCIYAYKQLSSKDAQGLTSGAYEGAYRNDNSLAVKGDVGTVFVQAGADTTLRDLISYCHTIPYGPSEAANFYGLGSSILADGQSSSPASTVVNRANGQLTLVNPQILGSENAVFAVAGGLVNIQGGNFFGASSGGHGMYVGRGGQILLNVTDAIVNANGNVNRDIASLRAGALQDRPAMDLGGVIRATDAEKAAQGNSPANVIGVFADHPGDVSVIATADETGTALTTDTGGGLIVANRVSATTFGRGCAGVYSIGANESWVYVMNSALHSNADAAICSAAGGYVYAFNTDLMGIAGLKTRANGSAGDAESGIEVYNSRVTVAFDPDSYDFYDMARAGDQWPEESSIWDNTFGPAGRMVNSPILNLFINKTNAQWGSDLSNVMSYWYENKNTVPQTGETVACILGTSAGTKVTVDSVQFINQNYEDYKNDTPVRNYLIASTNGADMVVEFRNENSRTRWDLTGKEDGTTELTGDILATAYATSDEPGTQDKPASADVTFLNSEWTGVVVNGDDGEGVMYGVGKNVSLHFDKDSTWTIPVQTAGMVISVGDLSVASLDCVTSAYGLPVTVQVFGTLTVNGRAITEDTTAGDVTFKVHPVSMYFSDLGAMAWAAEYVDNLAAREIVPMSGAYQPAKTATGADLLAMLTAAVDDPKAVAVSLDPSAPLTRGEAIEAIFASFKALNVTADEVEGDPLAGYQDARDSEALRTMVAMEIVKGTSSRTLSLGRPLTRGELAAMLSRTLEHVSSGMGMMPPPGMEGGMPGGPGGMPGMPGGDMPGGGAPMPPPN